MDDRHVLDDGADELHDAKEDEQLSVDNELFLFECLRKCLARWSLLMNLLSQFEQVNFFSPVCVRRWRERWQNDGDRSDDNQSVDSCDSLSSNGCGNLYITPMEVTV
jgi:hypothetical protein